MAAPKRAIMQPMVEQEATKAQPGRFLWMKIQMAVMEMTASTAMP